MKNKRSQVDIDRQIKGLIKMKEFLPETSFFGGNNWNEIDAKLDVLEGKKEPDDFYQDEHAEDFQDGDNDLYFEAERAERWLEGDENEDLFEDE